MKKFTISLIANIILSLALIALIYLNFQPSQQVIPNQVNPETKTDQINEQQTRQVKDYDSGSRQFCLAEAGKAFQQEYQGIIDSSCSDSYLDPYCRARILANIQNSFEANIERCLANTTP